MKNEWEYAKHKEGAGEKKDGPSKRTGGRRKPVLPSQRRKG